MRLALLALVPVVVGLGCVERNAQGMADLPVILHRAWPVFGNDLVMGNDQLRCICFQGQQEAGHAVLAPREGNDDFAPMRRLRRSGFGILQGHNGACHGLFSFLLGADVYIDATWCLR